MSKATLRIICHETDSNDATHVGGPVHIRHKSFDMEAPPELVAWFASAKYVTRAFDGVELITETTNAHP